MAKNAKDEFKMVKMNTIVDKRFFFFFHFQVWYAVTPSLQITSTRSQKIKFFLRKEGLLNFKLFLHLTLLRALYDQGKVNNEISFLRQLRSFLFCTINLDICKEIGGRLSPGTNFLCLKLNLLFVR